MAAVKAKKPTAKLKAGKKKKVNKWLIVGGVAAVAIIGAVVVRFSSASTWRSLWHSTNYPHSLTQVYSSVRTTEYQPYKSSIKLTKGGRYRFCLKGYNGSGKANIELSFWLSDLNGKTVGTRALSTKSYTSKAWSPATAELHCSAEFSAVKASYQAVGVATKVSGSGIFIPTALSVDSLR